MPRPTNAELTEKSQLAEQGLKKCRNCREVLPFDSFGVQAKSNDGLQPWCKRCINARNARYERASRERAPEAYAARKKREKQEWIERHPERHKASVRKNNLRKYGLTPESFDELFDRQERRCAICYEKLEIGRNLHIDHDHLTGVVRGLLCGGCNIGLGAFKESPTALRVAAEYVES